jgi:hypothetical protein
MAILATKSLIMFANSLAYSYLCKHELFLIKSYDYEETMDASAIDGIDCELHLKREANEKSHTDR